MVTGVSKRARSIDRPAAPDRAKRNLVGRLGADQTGVSAVEFALILPLMITLLFGAVELGDGLTISRKVTHVTAALNDLVTQAKTITNADMTNIINAATSIITPYDPTKLKIKVSEIKIDANSVATVVWSDASNDVALTPNTSFTVPAGVSQPSIYLIATEVHYSYKPTFGYVMTGTYDIKNFFYLRPRLTTNIARTAS